ncbi:MAG: hypothetical protein QM610_12025 [Chitinophagaceae bacterium]
MNYHYIFPILLTLSGVHSLAQMPDSQVLKQKEAELKPYAEKMIFSEMFEIRLAANTDFVKRLVKTLETPYSFLYPFDSLPMISIENAPDNSFRIFTWELQKDDNYYRQYGAIQMNTKDGKLKLFPLFDYSEFTEKPYDSVRSAKQWIGALYYKILKNTYKNKDYYTLLGLDDNDFLTTRKWIDILTFNSKGEPEFGAPVFQYEYDTIKIEPPTERFLFEYKKDTKARLNYDAELNAIVFDHLVSDNNKPWQKTTLIPSGLYEGFKWKDGRWVHIKDMFSSDPASKNVPVPHPMKETENNTF